MTESTDRNANCQFDSIQISIDQQQQLQVDSINDEFGLFNDDDDEDNLTLFDLKSLPKSNHDLSIFNELVQQCQDVISSTNHSQERTVFTIYNNKLDLSNTSTMINEYQQRFQKSLQKLTIPSWYNDQTIYPNFSSKPSIISQHSSKIDSHRTPEIVHIHRPHSYRSCRSSIGTSPSPSAHSWHPNCLIDGTNFTSGLSTFNSTNSHRHKKYQKGIERVTKSSHWYQPTQFKDKKQTISKHTQKNLETNSIINHYDVPTNFKSTSPPNDLYVENITINNHGNLSMMSDKQNGKSNELSTMPLENEKTTFDRIELEEVTDEEEGERTKSERIQTTSIERLADSLVESILSEILFSKTHDPDEEPNTGVRELSDDENALRELDENDMSGTDEFIVFATNDDATELETTTSTTTTSLNNENPLSPPNHRSSSNRLYTFSRNQDDETIKNPLKQDTSATSVLMIFDKDLPSTTTNLNVNEQDNSIDDQDSFPIYRSHIQKRHINLGRYYDGMMRAQTSHLPAYNLHHPIDSIPRTDDGITEETVRKGRILLDQIPKTIDNHESMPVRSILKNTRYEHAKKSNEDLSLKIEEHDRKSPRKMITTITEEYHRIHRKIIEEILDDFNPKQTLDSCPYQKLSDCYSGYVHFKNEKLTVPSNVSSLQTTTDEAYESEHTTASPRSQTNNSSIVTNIHPDLEHEFEYPTPPPPVPDRRLKPAHLRPPPPPTKPRTLLNQQENDSNVAIYSKIKKQQTKSSPLAAIQHLIVTNTNEPISTARTLSSRHFCGTIPANNDLVTSPELIDTVETKPKRNSKTSSKTKSKKSSTTSSFDEVTNGLAIRLPVTDSPTKNRLSTPSSTKRTDPLAKHRPMSENISTNRSSVYETSV